MPIYVAIPYLLVILTVLVGVGYCCIRWWKWVMWGALAIWLDYTLFMGSLRIWIMLVTGGDVA